MKHFTKKSLVYIVCFICLFTMSACGSSRETMSASKVEELRELLGADSESESDSIESAADIAEEEADISVEETDIAEEESAEVQTTTAGSDFSQVIVDNDQVKFEITGVDMENMWGYTWKVTAENKTDKNLMFSFDQVSVNGMMCDPFWATEVAAGKKSNEEVSWSSEDFEKSGITDVTHVSFNLRVYDSDDFMADSLVDEQFDVYPMGEDAAQQITRERAESDQVLFENDQASMIITGIEPDGMWGYTLHVYLENKTDAPLMFSADEVSVNDIMCDPYWATEVDAGKSSSSEISWMESTFEENGITEVEKIDMKLRVYASDDIIDGTILEEAFTITPKVL